MGQLIITGVMPDNPELKYDLIDTPKPDGLGVNKSATNLRWEGQVTFQYVSSGDMSDENQRSIRNKIAAFLLEHAAVIEL